MRVTGFRENSSRCRPVTKVSVADTEAARGRLSLVCSQRFELLLIPRLECGQRLLTRHIGGKFMHLRYLKIMFATLTSLMALIYVTQNMVNADAAHQAIIYVMSGADHAVYTNSFGTKFEGLDISRSIFKAVPGLFHVGSVGIIMSGWLGAINYGVIVANDVDGYIRGL